MADAAFARGRRTCGCHAQITRGVADAARRLDEQGPKALTSHGGASWLPKLGLQFAQPLVVVLIGAAALSVALGDHTDAAVIACVVMLNALIGFVHEYRAEQAINVGRARTPAPLSTEAARRHRSEDPTHRKVPAGFLSPTGTRTPSSV